MELHAVGIDLAKNVFQIHGANAHGKTVLQKRVSRAKLMETVAQLPPCLIGIEACQGAHQWARRFEAMGHTVRLISPQFVTPYRRGNKNDGNDAAAICEAVTRADMRFVPVKQAHQLDVQAVHRARDRIVKARTALINQIRGCLAEHGIVMPQGANKVRQRVPEILEDAENGLSGLARQTYHLLLEELQALDARRAQFDAVLKQAFKSDEACQRLETIPGVGILTATAMVAAVGGAREFKNGRQMAAFLGLVPRQHSSGEKQRLGGISKRGNTPLRTLLIHGARAVLRFAGNKTDARSRWLQALVARRGMNIAAVALANKTARTCWALLAKGECYRSTPA